MSRLVVVNYASNQSRCYVRLPFADLGGSPWRLTDLIGDAVYDWEGDGLRSAGLSGYACLEGLGLFNDKKILRDADAI